MFSKNENLRITSCSDCKLITYSIEECKCYKMSIIGSKKTD